MRENKYIILSTYTFLSACLLEKTAEKKKKMMKRERESERERE